MSRFKCIGLVVVLVDAGARSASADVLVPSPASAWVPEALVADEDDDEELGSALAIAGDVAVVGAPGEYGEGSAWRLEVVDGAWVGDELVPPVLGPEAFFGAAVGVDDVGGAYVGAPGYGRVFVFHEERGGELVVTSGVTDQFGTSIACAGDVVLVGDQTSSSGMMGPSGAVFQFYWNGSWQQVGSPILPPEVVAGQKFGYSLAVGANSADGAVIGAPGDDHNGVATGAVYRMTEDMMLGWALEKLVPNVGPPLLQGDRFGEQVALTDKSLLATTFASGRLYTYDFEVKEWALVDQNAVGNDGSHLELAVGESQVAIGDYDGFNSSGAVGLFELGRMFTMKANVGPPEAGVGGRFGWGLGLDAGAVWVSEPAYQSGRVHRFLIKADLGDACGEDDDCASMLCEAQVCSEPVGTTGEVGTTTTGETYEGSSTSGETSGDKDPSPTDSHEDGSSSSTNGTTGESGEESGEPGGVGFDPDEWLGGCHCQSKGAPPALPLLVALICRRRRRT